jgi:hypothetical protein
VGGYFDAVVQPLDFHLDSQQGWLGWWRYRKLRLAAEDLRAGIESGIQVNGGGRGGLPDTGRRRRCVAHVVIERRNFLLPLLEYAAAVDDTTLDEFYRGAARSRYLHLLDHDVNSGVFVPVDFETPFYHRSRLLPADVSVGSSVRLQAELESLHKHFGVDLNARVEAMKEFVHAHASELETRQESASFWVQFSFIVLMKLVRLSLHYQYPILLR